MEVLKKIIGSCLIALLLMLFNASILSAQTAPNREYQIKAVFLFNFTQFIEWPAASFSTSYAPLVIGVLGDNPFGTFLEETVEDEKIKGHPLVIQYYKTPEEIKTCHILFINLTEKNKLNLVLSKLKEKNTLTVSDASGFLQQGGMIRFYLKDNKVQIQINSDSAQDANLTISSKLLRVAEIYAPAKK